ncbi:MAG: acyl-CoA dehydrogenase family protein [Actinomycetota bacterium]|nr:acyl-CoA dehydrogenase family protein [Actinomycetota bacterium]
MRDAPSTAAEAVARAAEVGDAVARPLVGRTDSGVWPEEALRALQEAGLGGLVAPRTIGGSGLGLRALVAVCETWAGRVRRPPSATACTPSRPPWSLPRRPSARPRSSSVRSWPGST